MLSIVGPNMTPPVSYVCCALCVLCAVWGSGGWCGRLGGAGGCERGGVGDMGGHVEVWRTAGPVMGRKVWGHARAARDLGDDVEG